MKSKYKKAGVFLLVSLFLMVGLTLLIESTLPSNVSLIRSLLPSEKYNCGSCEAVHENPFNEVCETCSYNELSK